MSTSYAHFSMQTPNGPVESKIVTVTMTKEVYDRLVREADHVEDMAVDEQFYGGQQLADLVLDHIKDESIPLDPVPGKMIEVQAQPQSDGSYTVTYNKTLSAGDTLVIKGITTILSDT